MAETFRIAYVLDHPVQYYSPLFRAIGAYPSCSLRVHYRFVPDQDGTWDPGFDRAIQWDVDLLSGIDHVCLEPSSKSSSSINDRFRHMFAWTRSLLNSDFVVVHGYVGFHSILAIGACYLLRIPFALRADTSVHKVRSRFDPRRAWIGFSYRTAAGVLASGSRNRAISENLGARRILDVPFTVDVDAFFEAGHRIYSSRREPNHEVPCEQPTVVYSGKLAPHKRVGDVIEACERLRRDGIVVRLKIIGTGELEGHLRSTYEGPHVHFSGFCNQSEIAAELAEADVIVLPSEKEPWGLAINEGIAVGLIPVASDSVGCAPDLVEPYRTVFKTGDIDDLCSAIVRALNLSGSAEAKSLRSSFMSDYSIQASADAFVKSCIALQDDQG